MAKQSKISVPVTIAPSGGTNRVIALNQAIESFSYEERNTIRDMVMDKYRAKEAVPEDDKPEVLADRELETYFNGATSLIVKRATEFAKFLEN